MPRSRRCCCKACSDLLPRLRGQDKPLAMVQKTIPVSPLSAGQHVRAMLALGLPLIGSSLAQMALHVTDTVMMGWYGVTELAALVI